MAKSDKYYFIGITASDGSTRALRNTDHELIQMDKPTAEELAEMLNKGATDYKAEALAITEMLINDKWYS